MKNNISSFQIRCSVLVIAACLSFSSIKGQTQSSHFNEPVSKFWVNTYGNIPITDKLFFDTQTHFRFQQTANVPMVGQWAQIYSRQGLGYVFSKSFNATVGGVFRLNNNLDGVALNESQSVPEFRIWHQYQFAMPMTGLYVYHRLRMEHRWSKGFNNDSEYFFRNRYRYMLNVKIPINNNKLEEKTFYISPEAELIMQSGKVVGGSPLEDLRLHTSFGYILDRNVIMATGFMYSFGQDLVDGTQYKQGLVWRFHVYYFLNFKKLKKPSLPFEFLN